MSVHVRVWDVDHDDTPLYEAVAEWVEVDAGSGHRDLRLDGHVLDIWVKASNEHSAHAQKNASPTGGTDADQA